MRLRTALASAISLLAVRAAADPSFEAELAAIEQASQAAVCNPPLELRRASLEIRRGRLGDAAVALDRAQLCDPGNQPADLLRARLHLRSGEIHRAAVVLDAVLAREPDAIAARVLRGDVRAALADHHGAAEDYRTAHARAVHASPDLVLKLANASAAAGDRDGAIAVLDATINQVGPIPSLLDRVVALEVETGRTPRAIARLTAFADATRGQPRWTVRRAELLDATGRRREAHELLVTALADWDRARSTRHASGEWRRWRDRAERLAHDTQSATTAVAKPDPAGAP